MSILRNFEKRLEGAVEGTFAKTFRSGLQPVELAKRLVRDMEAGRSVGVDGRTVVPNRFVFTLSKVDMDRFEAAQGTLVTELSQVVRSNAGEKGWSLMGPPEVRFRTDDRLTKGLFRCEASLAQGVDPGPVAPAAAAASAPAHLTQMQGDRHGRRWELDRPITVLGRATECDIVLTDAAASRRHAQVTHSAGEFRLADLSSTNGTAVNGHAIGEHVLVPGDMIQIGQTTFEFGR
jgi:hypothetical protein